MKKNHNDKDEVRKNTDPTPDSNPDPITNEKGSHPVGVAAGGTGGAVTGSAIGGAVGGPIGAAVGAAVGAVAGGLAGKGVAEAVNPTLEEEYWRKEFKKRPYYRSGTEFEAYRPFYRYGWESAIRPEFRGKPYSEIEQQLETEWPSYHTTDAGEFSEYKGATRDAYERASRSLQSTHEPKSETFWDDLEGNWKQMKGAIKEKWNRLTDDDIEAMQGRRDRIIGKIQERYSESQYSDADIERELNELYLAKR